MNAIARVYQLNPSLVQTFFRRHQILNKGHLWGKTSQSHCAHHRFFSSSSTQVCSLNKPWLLCPGTDLTCNLNKLQCLQQVPFNIQKQGWQNQRRGIAADTKTTAVTIWEDLKQIRFSPVPALVLGFSGLIPFVAAPSYMIFNQVFSSQILFAQTAYGACILSFLGGVRWGFVIPEESECRGDWLNFGYSVTPALVAWTALLLPQPVSVLLVMGGIAGSAYFDTAVRGYPPWFKGLRFTLSFGAILSLWTVFLCQYMLGDASDKKAVKEDENK